VAKEARAAAWQQVGAQVSHASQLARTQVWLTGQSSADKSRRSAESRAAGETILNETRPALRYVLWIDAVGGFLLCRGDEITIGQAIPGNRVDVPILADLRGSHARIRREEERYVIQPLGAVRVGNRRVLATSLLSDGDEIQLGGSVRLRFRQPHPLSASARLEFLSRHRCPLAPDGILLMAESCVLGPHQGNHVVCRDWSDDVVLFWEEDQLFCRASDAFEIDGQACDGRGHLRPGSHVSGEDFSLSLEQV
jgi:hypothetical protein